MSLAFSACQKLSLPVSSQADRLPDYLRDVERVVRSLLDPRQLERIGPGHYRYTVTRVQIFQLQVQPIVELEASHRDGRLELRALDCQLEGLGLVEDFDLSLAAWLHAVSEGLEGEASLAVTVSRPSLLRLIPPRVLEATGRSVLNGILLGIKGRVGRQLVEDFGRWCEETAETNGGAAG